MKWLSDFEDKTNTSWKIDNNAVRAHQPKVISKIFTSKLNPMKLYQTKSNVLTMVYICEPLDSKKDCSGRLEMKLNQDDPDRNRKQYPCQVRLVFTITSYSRLSPRSTSISTTTTPSLPILSSPWSRSSRRTSQGIIFALF